MKYLKYLDTLLENNEFDKWVTVKNIKTNTKVLYNGISAITFISSMEYLIGKKVLAKPLPSYGIDSKTGIPVIWMVDGYYMHFSWLEFGEEGEQINLFPLDPEPAKIHWHSAGR